MSDRIFITGGASGLGHEIALRWARTGARVCIGDLHDVRGAQVEAEIREAGGTALFVHCDVTSSADLQAVAQRLASEWGGVDIVVNNAGVATAGTLEAEPIEQWEWILNINLLGVVRGCQAFAPLLRAQQRGHIVNIASMAGLVHPPGMGSYNASKAAVVAFSETLHLELVNDNIGVSVVCPSFFQTNLVESLRSTDPKAAAGVQKLLNKGRITAAGVADSVFNAVQANQFLVLPHADDRKTFRMKSWLPRRTYLNKMRHLTRKSFPGSPAATVKEA
ncbi:SDR family oxidoreductase [Pseudoduganella chitinolytica]|uniref:SDR family oxidoreductase n=1 Tax=Pseudoduganella chitinolytica TaxID=34070 RepID=A0ABY8B7G2_9BURK|nr:SDR family oxidoreductase [Pseudoduganella chitinolytica]WEF31735.1 SDR family oxidoreductase [Pseudoduganella chitinolytica]